MRYVRGSLLLICSCMVVAACSGNSGFKAMSSTQSSLVVTPGPGKTVQARVRIKDESGNPVPGADVSVTWEGMPNPTIAVTGSDGYAVFTFPAPNRPGPVTLTVDGVYKSHRFPYDRNLNRQSSASITTR